ncbi:MAG: GIY-YIG nuclease family protein, partial [Candidatus Omnitrophota bacterium]
MTSKRIKCKGTFFVYMVKCANGAYYTGYTTDLERRIKEHNGGKRGAKYTRARRPVVLVWSKEYKYFKKAVSMEARIKNLTRMQ